MNTTDEDLTKLPQKFQMDYETWAKQGCKKAQEIVENIDNELQICYNSCINL